MAKTKVSEAEAAVRTYLLFVKDPALLRDDKEVQAKTKAFMDAIDPIDKLKALAELEAVSNITEDPLRKAFVEHAKVWADEQGIPLAAFREMKVADDVLREAGFDVPSSSRRRGGEGRQRAKAVSVEDIKDYVTKLKGTFVLSDIMNGVGGSQATVRKALEELIVANDVSKLGPMPGYQGRGRAPLVYERTAKSTAAA